MDNNQRKQRRYAVFAVFMVVLMSMTAILPSIAPNTSIQQAIVPTATVLPTFPAPPADLSTIVFNETYLHTSGLYLVDYPEGWTPVRPSNNGTQVQVNFENTAAQSVIETYLDVPTPAVTTLQDVSARYNENTLRASWNRYNSWQETNREIDVANNSVVIDFELVSRGQTYLARHNAELKADGRIFVMRVVTPSNARALLLDLMTKAKTALHPVDAFAASPVAWTAYYSEQDDLIIRHPAGWSVTDGGAGSVVTIENPGSTSVLRIETVAGSAADEDAARAVVLALRPNAEIKTVSAVERNGVAGFDVSYVYRTAEGEPFSVLSAILPDGEDTLRVASVRLSNVDGDLLNTSGSQTALANDARAVIATFNLAAGLGLPVTEGAEDAG